jgi:hypothetical protein
MSDLKIEKIRYLLDDPYEEKVCLQDMIEAITNMSMLCAKLEIEQNRSAIVELKKRAKDFKKLAIDFNERVRGEVFNEVVDWQANNDPKSQGQGAGLRND